MTLLVWSTFLVGWWLRMTITVELWWPDLAEVTFRPALWRRLLLREDTQLLFAVRRPSGWHWDDTGKSITDECVLAKLRIAVDETDRARMVRQRAKARRDYAIDN